MKIKKYIIGILIISILIFNSNINYASNDIEIINSIKVAIPSSEADSGGYNISDEYLGYDEYGRPKTLEDFIARYNISSIKSEKELDKKVESYYKEDFEELGLNNTWSFDEYVQMAKNQAETGGGNQEEEMEYLKLTYSMYVTGKRYDKDEDVADYSQTHLFETSNVGDDDYRCAQILTEINGYYIAYKYNIIKMEYEEQEKREEELLNAIGNSNQKEEYEFNVNDWSPDSTTRVSNRIFFNENRK